MVLLMKGHSFRFELENICRLFLPMEKVVVTDAPPVHPEGVVACTAREEGPAGAILSCSLTLEDFHREETAVAPAGTPGYESACERTLATLLYRLFCELFGYEQSWGIITGVRPVKLLRQLCRDFGEEQALRYFRETMLVSEPKRALAQQTLHAEDRLLALSRPESCSLYVSIPFCPTRCDYCSFVSHTTERSHHLTPAYVTLLCEELRATGQIAKELGLRLETVYFGGGTPTSLEAGQLARLFETVERSFDLSTVREYTVEAGRPDTVTADKLRAIAAAGANRVSINPQTLHDPVLRAIGRRHTVEQFYRAYDLARQCGNFLINTDLIAGLPTDTPEGFQETLSGILSLSPENVTVHTLSRKRAAQLTLTRRADVPAPEDAVQMVEEATSRLPQAGYHPYYLYRQSRMVGNQENVGWAKEGTDGLYNVYIMDETHTILGCGAGAVTKLKEPGGDHLERIFNYKFPYEYNTGLREMLARKEGVRTFYERYPCP